jgi:putative ABC transport system permease protein
MNIFQSIGEAIESLNANKMRSALTILGIVIGVAAVIALLGIGSGTQNVITDEINNIGTNLIYVTSGGDADHPEPLTLEDAAAIADPSRAPSVIYVAPTLQGNAEVVVTGESTTTQIIGITPEFYEVQNANVAEGIQINQELVESRATVVLLGADVAEALFDTTTGLVGENVRINGQPFKVIGVLESEGGSAFQNTDDRVLIPLTTAQDRVLRRPNRGQVDLIYVQSSSSEAVSPAIDEVSQILRSRHRSTLGVDDFDIISTQSFIDAAETITGVFTIFLGGIAGISLLVGGIGIMNIMLVTVVERTKEIGLRKAMGARKRDILTQFLTESALLSLSGGLIGILIGYLLATAIGQIAAASGTPITPAIDINSILLATLFSAAIGLFFGLYPANRAANLEPVEALRAE